MEVIDLKDAKRPKYNALSYTWGNPFSKRATQSREEDLNFLYGPDQKYTVLVNGCRLIVTRNLYEGLSNIQARLARGPGEFLGPMDTDVGNLKPEDLEKKLKPFSKTPLIDAAERGLVDYLAQLLRCGANVHARDHFGDNALHYAAENGHLRVVKELTWYGANLSALDRHGRTALQGAQQWLNKLLKELPWRREKPVIQQYEQICAFLARPWQRRDDPELPWNKLGLRYYLWIDAICINQEDLAERAAQVKLMDRVYAQAEATLVWLGAEDETIKLAKRATWDIVRFAPIWSLGMIYKFTPEWNTSLNDKEIELCFEALDSLMERSWFQRVWVIQEVVRAKEIRIICGDQYIPWEALFLYIIYDCSPNSLRGQKISGFVSAGMRMREYQKDRSGLSQLVYVRSCLHFDSWERTTNLLLARQMGKRPPELQPKPSLAQLMFMTWGFRATDPRDQIYALLGMAEDTGIPIDYKIPVADLYQHTTNIFMRPVSGQLAAGGIRIPLGPMITQDVGPFFLGMVDGTKVHQDAKSYIIPSWIPDFNASLVNSPLLTNERPLLFSKSASQKASINKNRLHVSGVFFERITHTEGSLGRASDAEERLEEKFKTRRKGIGLSCYCPRTLFKILLELGGQYPTGESSVEAVLNILLPTYFPVHAPKKADITQFSKFARNAFKRFSQSLAWQEGRNDDDLLCLMMEVAVNDKSGLMPKPEEIWKYSNEANSITLPPQKYWGNPWPWKEFEYHAPLSLFRTPLGVLNEEPFFLEAMEPAYSWRRLFTIANGYVGVGPRTATPGDEIWYLAGQPAPCILRRVGVNSKEATYEFIGIALVHGIPRLGELSKGDSRFVRIQLA